MDSDDHSSSLTCPIKQEAKETSQPKPESNIETGLLICIQCNLNFRYYSSYSNHVDREHSDLKEEDREDQEDGSGLDEDDDNNSDDFEDKRPKRRRKNLEQDYYEYFNTETDSEEDP